MKLKKKKQKEKKKEEEEEEARNDSMQLKRIENVLVWSQFFLAFETLKCILIRIVHFKEFLLVSLIADFDECSSENECHTNATCTNTNGSYNCTCKRGFQGDGRNCNGKILAKSSVG